jgi:uncharacterized protein YecE (DUF72 family)
MSVPSTAAIHLGTQGWSYTDWIGCFYPPGARQEHYLPFYSSIFDTVELDTTFYHAPRASVVRSWARHTPDGFRFAAKLPRAITHDAGLSGVADLVRRFADALAPLEEKLGPLLAQMPAEFVRDERTAAALEQFLAEAPTETRFAVEFRHASWHVAETFETLRRHRAALAWTEWRELPRLTEVTTDFLYLRWLGDRREILSYDRVVIDRTRELNAWELDLQRVLPEVREVFGYFNNHWAGHSPASANAMKRRLGLEIVDPAERWPQRELF